MSIASPTVVACTGTFHHSASWRCITCGIAAQRTIRELRPEVAQAAERAIDLEQWLDRLLGREVQLARGIAEHQAAACAQSRRPRHRHRRCCPNVRQRLHLGRVEDHAHRNRVGGSDPGLDRVAMHFAGTEKIGRARHEQPADEAEIDQVVALREIVKHAGLTEQHER